MAMMHTDLVNHYERVFAFQQYHKWAITEIEDMMPWEFEVMTSLLANYIQKVELDKKQEALNRASL